MTAPPFRRVVLLGALLALVLPGTSLRAQSEQDRVEIIRYPGPALRIGQDLNLRPTDIIRHGVVIAGSARIEGRVRGDLFVWLGDAHLTSTAVVDGALVVVAGNVVIEPGAVVEDEFVSVGGTVTRPDTFEAGREEVMIGFPQVGAAVRSLVPWITDGLLLARPLVPSLPWMRTIVIIAFVLGLVLTLLFHGPVKAAATVVVERPLSVLLTGALVLLLAGPMLVIVSATIVGIAVLPVVLCAMAVAWTIAKVGVARGIGHRLFAESDPESRLQSVRSFVLGFVAIMAAYMVPVLGFVTWSLVSVFGLGAAFMTMTAALRREYPAKEKSPKTKGRSAGPPSQTLAEPPATPRPAQPLEGAMPFVAIDPDPAAGATADPPGNPTASEPEPPPVPPPPRRPTAGVPGARGLLAYPYASFLDRAAGFALDCVLLALVVALFNIDDEWQLPLVAGYFMGFWAWQGTTLGGIIVGLRVVRTDGEPVRFVDAFIRGISSVFSFGVLAVGLFWMIQDPDRQTWHDKIAGTFVVKVPRDLPLSS